MTTAGWNVLLYAIAEDHDQHVRITEAVAHMRDALTTDRCNVVVQLHTKTRTTRHWISSGQNVQTDVLPAVVDPGEPSSLTMFMNAAHRKLPAESTALLLYEHGNGLDGASGGASGGSGTHQRLTKAGMKQGIARSRQNRVEILGLNACWMALFEIVYELRGVSDVQIASQVSAEVWPYGAIVAALAAAPDASPEQLASKIVAAVHADIAAGKRDDALSALRSGPALDELATAFDAYAKRAKLLIDSDWESVSRAVMSEAQRVDDPCSVDLVSLIHQLGKHDLKSKIAAASVATKFGATLLAHTASEGHPGVHGLSVFCPRHTQDRVEDAYQGTEFRSSSWGQFLRAFQARLSRSPSA